MSFFDDLVDFGKTALNFITGSSPAASVARTALTGYALSRVSKSIAKDNAKPDTTASARPDRPVAIDRGVRVSVNASTDNSIPIVYGVAFVGGQLTDARISANNQVMTYVLTISERTGVKLSDSAQSSCAFDAVYWNDQKINFDTNGITALSTTDRDGNTDTTIANLVQVRCYNNGSTGPVYPTGFSGAALANAYDIVPGWGVTNSMSGLVFAVVQVTYSSDKNVTGLPQVKFKINNSMHLPGDVLFDYMTNTRYGAGIAPGDIYAS